MSRTMKPAETRRVPRSMRLLLKERKGENGPRLNSTPSFGFRVSSRPHSYAVLAVISHLLFICSSRSSFLSFWKQRWRAPHSRKTIRRKTRLLFSRLSACVLGYMSLSKELNLTHFNSQPSLPRPSAALIPSSASVARNDVNSRIQRVVAMPWQTAQLPVHLSPTFSSRSFGVLAIVLVYHAR